MDEPVNLFNYLVGDLKAVDKNGMNALMWASLCGAYEKVDEFINKGYDIKAVDKDGRNALMYASGSRNTKTVELLINKGSDIKVVDKDGKNALMYASENGNDKTVDLLINKGSDVNAVDKDGKNALIYGLNCTYNFYNFDCFIKNQSYARFLADKISGYLIKSGADVNFIDKNGWSALMYAAGKGAKRAVELLVKSGCDVLAVNKDGNNALAIASKYGFKDIVEFLSSLHNTNVIVETKQHVDRVKCLVKSQPSKEDDIVKQVIGLDISEDLVKKTLQKRLEDKGTTFESAEALIESILKDNFSRPSASLSGDPLVSTQLKKGNTEVKELLRCRNCYNVEVDTKFEPCGHLTCSNCGFDVDDCPICESPIKAKKNLSYIVILALIIKNIISEDDMQQVNSKPTRTERTEALLNLILRAGPRRAFPEFINSLRKDYPQVVDRLHKYDDEIYR
ncbi:ankycorbin-like [Physella acuta]|uniref:ankycorbin-like n=1 Tax=Physella acuta TaxID=109671 RepID=UPI0027DABF64|nr:ankycorbin-like [Physella acuta]